LRAADKKSYSVRHMSKICSVSLRCQSVTSSFAAYSTVKYTNYN